MKLNKSASMISKTLSVLALSSGMAAAASVVDNQRAIEDKVDSANAKRGLEVTGAIRGVAEASYLTTDQDKFAKDQMPDVERNEFVNADFNFKFRPWEPVRVNAMLRLYAGMQDYFASAAKVIEVPWLNVEGQIGNNFYWVVGDFRQQYSPLTLFTPGLDIMYEPTIFARQRHMAEKQMLIEGNQRNLQGVNLQFRTDLNPTVGELRVEGIFARVNRSQALDLTGAEGNILPGDSLPGASQASAMDKFMAAGNVELFPLQKNLYVGLTGMYIFDNEDSYTYTERHPNYDVNLPYEIQHINPFEIDPQNTTIISGRVGGDVAGLLGNSSLVLDLTAEVAMSIDDNYTTIVTESTDAEGNVVPVFDKEKETENGMAILANINAGYKASSFGVTLSADVVLNDSAWFNNMAQSSMFFAQRVLNSDYDGNTVKYSVNSPLYSSFDALYHFAPKFSPVSTVMRTDGKGLNQSTQSDSYNIGVYNKNSWTTNVYSKAQLALLQSLADPALQLALPNGLATANRTGARGVLKANVEDWAEVQGLFTYMMQSSPILGFTDVNYMEFGGGAKADIFKVIGFKTPLEISGSYKHSERTSSFDAAVFGIDGDAALKSDFINAGLYVQYLPRLGFTAGFQMINTELDELEQNLDAAMYLASTNAKTAPLVKGSEMQWMVGLDYTLEKNAWLSLNFGMVSVENTYNVAARSGGEVNLPIYFDPNVDTGAEYTDKFTQTIVQASLNVEF